MHTKLWSKNRKGRPRPMPRRRWDHFCINLHLKEIGRVDVDWVYMVQDVWMWTRYILYMTT
jgi:hypothetical protein